MTEPFLGEIRVFSFPKLPKGWAYCDGANMPIQQNSGLYSLLGTQFGGDGKDNFNLPNLQGQVPLGTGVNPNSGATYANGNKGGALTVTVSATMMPAHLHLVGATTTIGDTPDPTNAIMAQASQGTDGGGNTSPTPNLYGAPADLVALNTAVVTSTGAGQPHANVQPYTTVTFVIALAGIYPTRP